MTLLCCTAPLPKALPRPAVRLHRLAAVVLCLTPIYMGLNCPAEFTPPPRLRYINVNTSQISGNPGDLIQITWEFENEDLLVKQGVRFLSPLLLGIQEPPPDFELDNGVRALEFEFTGPVTVVLHATDVESDSFNENQAEINIAFDISLDEAFGVTATIGSYHPDYPRLGYPIDSFDFSGNPQYINARIIDFSQYIAIYDLPAGDTEFNPGQRDGIIAELANTPGLSNTLSFFEDFRAHSSNPSFETAIPFGIGFLFTQGLQFPDLSEFMADFLGVDPQPSSALLFAGAIVYSGTQSTVKTEGGELIAFENAIDFEPIFLCIDLIGVGNEFLVSDVHIGNLSQGLVCSAERKFEDVIDNDDIRTSGQQSFEPPNVAFQGAIGTFFGNIKGARIGAQVVTTAGEKLASEVFADLDPIDGTFIEVENIDFFVPLHPDTDLGGRIPVTVDGVSVVITGGAP